MSGKPVIPAFGFLRCESALVPLCIRRAIAQYEIHDVIVWWATPLEIQARALDCKNEAAKLW